MTAGILIGPMALGLIDNSKSIFQLAELGIILLLFMVGLELSPLRLKTLRKDIILEGGSQMFLTTFIFSTIGVYLGLNFIAAFIVGFSLSLSSTAIVLFYLKDSSQLTLSHGQTSLSILLFQDIIIIPVLALIPILSNDGHNITELLSFSSIAFKSSIFFSLIIFCLFILRPALTFIKKTQEPEIFLAACLFLIIGMAIGMDQIGFSKAMGAFIAGMFLANSEIKQDIKNVTLPFKGMLMGLFFMTLGIELNLNFLVEHINQIGFICLSIFIIKSIILLGIGWIRNGSYTSGIKLSLLISQGGEFGLVVLATALQFNLLNQDITKLLITCITLSILIAPLLAQITGMFKTTNQNQESDSNKIVEEQTIDSSNVIPLNSPLISNKKVA